jgi:hypothetical protein
MGKVEFAPATVRDTGVSLATWGGCLLYFAAIAILDGLTSPLPLLGNPLAWVTPVLLIAGVMLVVGGVVILALDRRN